MLCVMLNKPSSIKHITMRFFITTALIIFFYLTTYATAQYPDKIIFNGKEYSLHSNPLETYFEKNPDKRPKGGVISTALWRGYVATFEVRGSQLFVKDIQIEYWDWDTPNKKTTKQNGKVY